MSRRVYSRVSTRAQDFAWTHRWTRSAFGTVLLAAALCESALQAKTPPPGAPQELPAVFQAKVPASLADLKILETHVEALVQKVSPAVVSVIVGGGAGSGVVISPDGLVLCAAHVCGLPHRSARFTFPDGRAAFGETLGTDHSRDAGLMKITTSGHWPYVDIGAPEDLRLGDWVLALGHPGGFDPARPVVARLGRVIRSGRLLQTDCTLMAGDSGGPLFDMSGRVIGIHSRISESAAENFHVPIAAYLADWERLEQGDNWGDERPPGLPTIGVHGVNDPDGCRIESLNEDSPASRAGLLPGDVIVRINGEPVPDRDCLAHQVRQTEPGRVLTLSVRRDSQEVDIRVTVEERRRQGGPGGRWRPGR